MAKIANIDDSAGGRLPFLDGLRAIAIAMVVGVHTLGYCNEIPAHQRDMLRFLVQAVSVPVFFLVDGYLLARTVAYSKKYSYLNYLRKSFFRLFVPWLAFTGAYTLARYAFETTGFLKEHLILGHTMSEVVIRSYSSVYAPQMYFLLSLFLIRFFAPVLERVVLTGKTSIVLLSFFAYYAAYEVFKSLASERWIAQGQDPILHAFWGAQFFIAGIVVFKLLKKLNPKTLTVPLLIAFVLAFLMQRIFDSYHLRHLVQYLYVLTLFSFFASLSHLPAFLLTIGKNTMGIYLLHAPILLKFVSLILNRIVPHPLLSFASVLLGTLLSSFFLVNIMNSTPYLNRLLGTPNRVMKEAMAV